MSAEFQLPEGVDVGDLTGIYEAYSTTPVEGGFHVLTVNVSVENIYRVFSRLAGIVKEPAFLVLELGTHRDVELQLRKSDFDPLHRDVYYLDGQNWQDVKTIVDQFSHLLVHDGEINFGFGSHEGHDEVFVGPYKIFTIYADDPLKYETELAQLEYQKEEHVRTVWDNFSEYSPGRRRALTDATPTIWDMIEELKAKGLYLAERREGG